MIRLPPRSTLFPYTPLFLSLLLPLSSLRLRFLSAQGRVRRLLLRVQGRAALTPGLGALTLLLSPLVPALQQLIPSPSPIPAGARTMLLVPLRLILLLPLSSL